MSRWCWIDKRALLLLHDESLAEHGGAAGMYDEGLLDFALARPSNLDADGDPDVHALSAAYGFGLAKNQAFVDGNKRVAFFGLGLFLALNGWRPMVTQAEATLAMLDVAAGAVDEDALVQWLRDHSARR